MARKPFIGLHDDCPDLSGTLPDMLELPALPGIVDADIVARPPFRRRRAPWTPYTEDGCGPVKVEPGRIRDCYGNERIVLPGSTPTDECGGLVIDTVNNSHHWLRTDVRTGLSVWVQGNAFPPARIGHAFVNTPILKLGKTHRLYEYAPAVIAGTKIVSADVKIKLAVTTDGQHDGCYEEADEDDTVRPYRIVTLGADDTLREKYEKIAAALSGFEDVTAAVTARGSFLKILVITTGSEFPATAGNFSASDPEHASLLMSSIVQLKDAAIDGFMPGDCEELEGPLGCCSITVPPIQLIDCDGRNLYKVYPPGFDPAACDHPQVDICDPENSHHWLDITNGFAVWGHGTGWSKGHANSRESRFNKFVPVLRAGRTDRFRKLSYTKTTAVTIEGVTPVERAKDDTSPECRDEAPVRPQATITERWQATVTRTMQFNGDVTALVFPDEDDPDNAGVVIATSYGRVLTFGLGETFSSANERHCEVLQASIQSLIDGPVPTWTTRQCNEHAEGGGGGNITGCCTLEVNPVDVVDCDDNFMFRVMPPGYEPGEYGPFTVSLCDPARNRHYLDFNVPEGEDTWQRAARFPWSTPSMRTIPLMVHGRVDELYEKIYSAATTPGPDGVLLIPVEYGPEPETMYVIEREDPATADVGGLWVNVPKTATLTEWWSLLIAEYTKRFPGVTALVFPDEDDPDNKGTIYTILNDKPPAPEEGEESGYGSKVAVFDRTDERHCEVLHASINWLVDEAACYYSAAECASRTNNKRPPWRPYDFRPSGAVGKTKINGGEFRWSDGTVTQVAPFRVSPPPPPPPPPALPADASEVTVGGASNQLYLSINTATRSIEWALEDDCLPQRVGDVLNVRVLRMGLTALIKSLNAPTANYTDGEEFEVGGITYVFGNSATGNDIPVPLGSTPEESLATLASRINNTHPTVSAIVTVTGSGAAEKTSLIATSVDPDEDMGDIADGGTASSEDTARLLAASFKYDLDGEFSPGSASASRSNQFEPRVVSASAMTIAIGPGDVARPGAEGTITSNGEADRFEATETISADVSKFWLQAQIYPAVASLASSIVCKRDSVFPAARSTNGGLIDDDIEIYNNIPVAEAVRTASVAEIEYAEVDEDDEPEPYPDDITIDGVVYTFVEGPITSDTQVPIGASKGVTYGTLAYMVSRSSNDLHAGNFPACDGKSGYMLVASYSRAAVPDTTAGAYLAADDQHKAFVMSSVRGLCGRDRVVVCSSDDVDLRSFRVLYLTETTGYLLPGNVHVIRPGEDTVSTTTVTGAGEVVVVVNGAAFLKINGVGTATITASVEPNEPAKADNQVVMPLYTATTGTNSIKYQHVGDAFVYLGGLPNGPDNHDALLAWRNFGVPSDNRTVDWYPKVEIAPGLVYFDKDGKLGVLPSTGANFQVLQVYNNEWKVDDARIR